MNNKRKIILSNVRSGMSYGACSFFHTSKQLECPNCKARFFNIIWKKNKVTNGGCPNCNFNGGINEYKIVR